MIIKKTFQCTTNINSTLNFLLRQYYNTDVAKLCKWLNILFSLKIHDNYFKKESLVRNNRAMFIDVL